MLVDQGVKLAEARLRGALGRSDRGAHHAEQPTHLVEGGAGRVADRGEPLGAELRQAGDGEPGALCLDGDRRDVVGDDVVQLAGDPRALVEQRLLAQRPAWAATLASRSSITRAAAAQQTPKPRAAMASTSTRKLRAPASHPLNGVAALTRNGTAIATEYGDVEMERGRAQHERQGDDQDTSVGVLLSACWAMMASAQIVAASRGKRLTKATGATVARADGNSASACSPSRTMDSPTASSETARPPRPPTVRGCRTGSRRLAPSRAP